MEKNSHSSENGTDLTFPLFPFSRARPSGIRADLYLHLDWISYFPRASLEHRLDHADFWTGRRKGACSLHIPSSLSSPRNSCFLVPRLYVNEFRNETLGFESFLAANLGRILFSKERKRKKESLKQRIKVLVYWLRRLGLNQANFDYNSPSIVGLYYRQGRLSFSVIPFPVSIVFINDA